MKRRVFNLLAAVSLILFMATAIIDVRSYWVNDTIERDSPTTADVVSTDRGYFLAQHVPAIDHFKERSTTHLARTSPAFDGARLTNRFGLSLSKVIAGGTEVSKNYTVVFSLGYILVLSALAPVIWALLWLRRRRLHLNEPGRCPTCGYDLRATPQRCPECGAVPSPVKGVAT